MTASSARWLYFGNRPQIDTVETNYTNENIAAVLNTATSSSLKAVIITANDTDNSGVLVSDDNGQAQETFSYDLGAGPVTIGYDSEAIVSIIVTRGDGSTYSATVTLYQMDNGDVFLFEPDVFDYQNIQAVQITAMLTDSFYGTTTPLSADGDVDIGAIVCFCAETAIHTPRGPVPVESLCPGDTVTTADSGDQPLRWIGQRHVTADELARNPALRPIRIAAGALGNGLPIRDLCVSPQHRMLIASPIAQRMFGTSVVLVAAKHLVALPGIAVDDRALAVTYVHMLFDQHEIVFAEGAATESLFTGPEALKALNPATRTEILALFPQLADSAADARHLIRPEIRGGAARRLAQRHARNAQHALQSAPADPAVV